MEENKHHDNQFWIGLFLGGLIGALLIILLGTEKGKKIAKLLEEKGLDFLDDTAAKFEDKVDEIEKKSEELIEKGQELIQEGKSLEAELAEKVVSARNNLTTQAAKKADNALAHIEALQEHGRQSTAEIRRKLFKNIPKKS